MNKILASIITFLVLGSIFTKGAYASEGAIKLNPVTGNSPVCLTNSVYIDGAYHLLMTCRGLVTPYSAEVTRYALWQYSPETKKWLYVGRLNQGKFDGVAQAKFNDLMITAEEKNTPRTPSEFVVAKGSVVPFEFDKSATPIVTSMPSATPTPTPTVATNPGQSGSVISRVAGTVLRLLVIAFVVVLVAVVVMTVITRRREMA
jgi:hypothetical protein